MSIFDKLHLSPTTEASIAWETTPDLAFCTFSAKGLREGLNSSQERVCYFFIDNWGEKARLYLMERGVRYVNILAEIKAPVDLLSAAIVNHGAAPDAKGNFPIDAALKDWLLVEVVTAADSPYLIPTVVNENEEEPAVQLPPPGQTGFRGPRTVLNSKPGTLNDDQVGPLIAAGNFFDAERNPQGAFANALADSGNPLTVIDERTGLLWQRGGLDLCSYSSMKKKIEELNRVGLDGHHDWRLPTLAEAMSLLEPQPNPTGLHLPACFSQKQPFIFTADRRQPTGYWFVDYARARAYWSSGTVPGGFGRLCRNLE